MRKIFISLKKDADSLANPPKAQLGGKLANPSELNLLFFWAFIKPGKRPSHTKKEAVFKESLQCNSWDMKAEGRLFEERKWTRWGAGVRRGQRGKGMSEDKVLAYMHESAIVKFISVCAKFEKLTQNLSVEKVLIRKIHKWHFELKKTIALHKRYLQKDDTSIDH